MLKECLCARKFNFEGGKIGVIKGASRNRKIEFVGHDTVEVSVRQGWGMSEDLETFIDRKVVNIKMGDLVPADPN